MAWTFIRIDSLRVLILSKIFLLIIKIRSREEIHEWQEIQNRVELEGEKIAARKKATVRFEDEYNSVEEAPIKSVKNSIDMRNLELNNTSISKSLKVVFGNVCLRKLWTDTAELLIQQVGAEIVDYCLPIFYYLILSLNSKGRYQSARQYLTEAQFSAEVRMID